MKRLLTLVLTLAILTSTTFAHATTNLEKNVEARIGQTALELDKIKSMDGVEFELYLLEQAAKLENHGYIAEADQLRMYADKAIKADFEDVIETQLNDSASNGLLVGVAIVGCSSIGLCPILVFLALCTFSDLQSGSEI